MASAGQQRSQSWNPVPGAYEQPPPRNNHPAGWPTLHNGPSEERPGGLPSMQPPRDRHWEEGPRDGRSQQSPGKGQHLPSVRSLLNPEPSFAPPPRPSHRPTHSTGSAASADASIIPPPPPPPPSISHVPYTIPGLPPTSTPSFRPAATPAYPTPAATSSPVGSERRFGPLDTSSQSDPQMLQLAHEGSVDEDPTSPLSMTPSRRRPGGNSRNPVRISRCIGQRQIAGEGNCFLYEDGTFCRTSIDGEAVNPSWGVTKAGKPRKRLAQACLTCREKKIKCEPGVGAKCVQCTKARRVCRGIYDQSATDANARGNPLKRRLTDIQSPSSSAAFLNEIQINAQGYRLKNMYGKFPDQASLTPEPVGAPHHARSTPHDVEMPDAPMGRRQMLPPLPPHDAPAVRLKPQSKEYTLLITQEEYARAFDADPFEDDAESCLHFLHLFFTHINPATYYMLPRDHFMNWVRNCRTKSADDRMLLYVLMAMGSCFSFTNEDKAASKHLAKVATYAVERRSGHYSLQLIQSRLMLSFFNFARGKAFDAWDLCGGAYRTISAMNYNVEDGLRQIADDAILEYGLDRARLEECRRRSFWAAFLMDRYNGFCGGTLLSIDSQDTYSQLPGPEYAFEGGESIEGPLFDPDIPMYDSETASRIGAIGHLVLVSSIWGDVLTFTSRTSKRPPQDYAKVYHDYCALTQQRAERWLSQLPPHLRWSVDNVDDSIRGGYAGTFISLYALYHTAFLRLYRHARIAELPTETVHNSILRLRQHAKAWISIMGELRKTARDQRLKAYVPPVGPRSESSYGSGRQGSVSNTASPRLASPRVQSTTSTPTSGRAQPASASPVSMTNATLALGAPKPSASSTGLLQGLNPSATLKDPTDFVFSTPFSGYAFLLSCDVISAGGPLHLLSDVSRDLAQGLETVDELAQFWTAARAQQRAVKKRLNQLHEVVIASEKRAKGEDQDPNSAPQSYPASAAQSGGEDEESKDAARFVKREPASRTLSYLEDHAGTDLDDEDDDSYPKDMSLYWRLDAPLETMFEKPNDMMYGPPDEAYFRALQIEEKSTR